MKEQKIYNLAVKVAEHIKTLTKSKRAMDQFAFTKILREMPSNLRTEFRELRMSIDNESLLFTMVGERLDGKTRDFRSTEEKAWAIIGKKMRQLIGEEMTNFEKLDKKYRQINAQIRNAQINAHKSEKRKISSIL